MYRSSWYQFTACGLVPPKSIDMKIGPLPISGSQRRTPFASCENIGTTRPSVDGRMHSCCASQIGLLSAWNVLCTSCNGIHPCERANLPLHTSEKRRIVPSSQWPFTTLSHL